jgi:hypothetical protein
MRSQDGLVFMRRWRRGDKSSTAHPKKTDFGMIVCFQFERCLQTVLGAVKRALKRKLSD